MPHATHLLTEQFKAWPAGTLVCAFAHSEPVLVIPVEPNGDHGWGEAFFVAPEDLLDI